MKFSEYEAKIIFRRYGITVPNGVVVRSVNEVAKAYSQLGRSTVVKPLTLSKRRGKAGLIRFAHTLGEAEAHVEELLNATFEGENIRQVLLEEYISGQTELYVAITIDRSKGKPVAILSSRGGIEIESIKKQYPEEIFTADISILRGLTQVQIRELLGKVPLNSRVLTEFTDIFLKLYEIFTKYDAIIVEINPIKVTPDVRLVAVDAVINIDDDALFRHPELDDYLKKGESDLEDQARHLGISFVKLDGNIGIIGNGAGLTMTTSDLVSLYKGKPAYFIDIGGGVSSDKMEKVLGFALEINTKVVLINILAGISRCDELARGIRGVKKQGIINQPLIVRMMGTNLEEGVKILESIGIRAVTSLEEAVRNAVALAGENR